MELCSYPRGHPPPSRPCWPLTRLVCLPHPTCCSGRGLPVPVLGVLPCAGRPAGRLPLLLAAPAGAAPRERAPGGWQASKAARLLKRGPACFMSRQNACCEEGWFGSHHAPPTWLLNSLTLSALLCPPPQRAFYVLPLFVWLTFFMITVSTISICEGQWAGVFAAGSAGRLECSGASQ